jgi:hypothetical protein
MTNQISIQQKVLNYQGQSTFILNLKQSLQKYGGLTPKQLTAAEKTLNGEVKVLDLETLPENLKVIVNYEGESNFVKDISSKLKKYGTLTEKQKTAALNAIQKEEDQKKSFLVHWATPGQTIQVGRKVGQGLKEKYELEFNPIILDITEIIEVRPKAIKFKAKMTSKRGNVCSVCNKTLTDDFSMITGMGKICAGHLKVDYITDRTQAEAFRERYLKRIEEIGEMEVWAPKSSIKEWEGGKSHIHKVAVESLS